jgi:plastocyanin
MTHREPRQGKFRYNFCSKFQSTRQSRRSVVSTASMLALMVISFIIGIGVTVIAYNVQAITPTHSTSTTVSATSIAASINQKPTVLPVKVDWCNTDNTGEDRFCPDTIEVVQGDIVQIMFIENDTDTHTFTLVAGLYDFQINDTVAGSANFLHNKAIYNSSCINANYALESTGVSTSYCVSGSSLLSPSFLASHQASDFGVSQNGNPGEPLGSASNSQPSIISVSDEVHYGDSANLSSVSIPANATGSEEWGIGAFQASYVGVYEYTCVYHVSNGMFGYLIVLPNAYCVTNATVCGLSSSQT